MPPTPPPPPPSKKPKDAKALTYEQALAEVESIIDRIESGEIGLEQSIEAYERGSELIKRCRSMLQSAEQRVEELSEALERDAGDDAPGRAD